MRKNLTLFLIVALSLVACTLPQSSALTPTANAMETLIAKKLTQAPNNTPLPANPTTKPASLASPTAAAAASATQAPATTAAPTLTPTLPAGATTQAPTATATATTEPGDPKTGLGSPTLKDTFQKPSTWGLDSPYDDGHTRVSISPGKIILTSLEGNNWHGWRIYNAKVQNFYMEAVLQTGACAGSDLYGLVFRSPDSFKGYWFGLTCDGKYNLFAGDVNNMTEIIKAKTNPLIKSGSNQVNRLGVMAKGNKISLYANGKLLEDITSDIFTGAGVFGYFIAGEKTVNFSYESTELSYWKLP